jgi:hypothetical protein
MARIAGKPKKVAVSGDAKPDASRKSPPIADVAQRLGRMIPNEELRLIPEDLSEQIDHYLYGAPKR